MPLIDLCGGKISLNKFLINKYNKSFKKKNPTYFIINIYINDLNRFA